MKKLKDLRKELKQRNLVHLNAPKSGAGKHVDRKRQMNQGYQILFLYLQLSIPYQ